MMSELTLLGSVVLAGERIMRLESRHRTTQVSRDPKPVFGRWAILLISHRGVLAGKAKRRFGPGTRLGPPLRATL